MVKSTTIVLLNSTKEQVWNIITNNHDYSWRSDLSKIENLNDKEFIEYNKSGFQTRFAITTFKPFELYEFDISNDNLSGHWIGKIKEKNGLIQLELNEMIESDKMPKIIIKLYLRHQQKKYIKDLIKVLSNNN